LENVNPNGLPQNGLLGAFAGRAKKSLFNALSVKINPLLFEAAQFPEKPL